MIYMKHMYITVYIYVVVIELLLVLLILDGCRYSPFTEEVGNAAIHRSIHTHSKRQTTEILKQQPHPIPRALSPLTYHYHTTTPTPTRKYINHSYSDSDSELSDQSDQPEGRSKT